MIPGNRAGSLWALKPQVLALAQEAGTADWGKESLFALSGAVDTPPGLAPTLRFGADHSWSWWQLEQLTGPKSPYLGTVEL